MLTNIHIQFGDSRSNTFGATRDTTLKWLFFTKSGAITPTLLNESARETPGAQLHMLNNIPLKFGDSRSNTFGATCDTTLKWPFFY